METQNIIKEQPRKRTPEEKATRKARRGPRKRTPRQNEMRKIRRANKLL